MLRTQWVKIHPIFLHSEIFTVYAVGENSPMPSSLKVSVKFHPEHAACKNYTLWQFFKLLFHQPA